MFGKNGRLWVRAMLALLAAVLSCANAAASDLLLADGKTFPGQLWQSRDGQGEWLIFREQATPNRAYPNAVMKIGHVAVGPDGKAFFASGLDGYVLHLLDRSKEVVSFEFPGQIRDIDTGGEEHTVYFSVVATPQNGAPLADGKIYRRDLWAGQPSEVFTVVQAQVGNNWWGTFAVQNGSVYIATLENPSRIFRLSSADPERVYIGNRYQIQGLAATADGSFYFTDGTANVYRTKDFDTYETVFRGARPYSDVAVEPAAPSP
jgi:hypothetical protein